MAQERTLGLGLRLELELERDREQTLGQKRNQEPGPKLDQKLELERELILEKVLNPTSAVLASTRVRLDCVFLMMTQNPKSAQLAKSET